MCVAFFTPISMTGVYFLGYTFFRSHGELLRQHKTRSSRHFDDENLTSSMT